MQKLLIKDFSLQVQTEFEHPVPESQVDLVAIADKLITAFPRVIRTEDISITSERRPYDYRLFCKFFNGSADLLFSNKNVILNFRDGRTSQALNLVAKSIEAIYKIVAHRSIQFNQLTFALHAEFGSAEQFSAHMTKFRDADRGYLSGGRIVQAEGRSIKGDVRFSYEKSIAFDNAIFVNVQFLIQEDLSGESLEQMAKRFAEIVGYEGFELSFPQ